MRFFKTIRLRQFQLAYSTSLTIALLVAFSIHSNQFVRKDRKRQTKKCEMEWVCNVKKKKKNSKKFFLFFDENIGLCMLARYISVYMQEIKSSWF